MSAATSKVVLVMRALLRVARGYAIFATLHVVYKVLKKRYLLNLKVKSVAGLPGRELDRTAKGLRSNLHRLQDYRSVSCHIAMATI
jgi:hypothetical protein